jgi:hypothetical protein
MRWAARLPSSRRPPPPASATEPGLRLFAAAARSGLPALARPATRSADPAANSLSGPTPYRQGRGAAPPASCSKPTAHAVQAGTRHKTAHSRPAAVQPTPCTRRAEGRPVMKAFHPAHPARAGSWRKLRPDAHVPTSPPRARRKAAHLAAAIERVALLTPWTRRARRPPAPHFTRQPTQPHTPRDDASGPPARPEWAGHCAHAGTAR